jgi:serine phosphatase RsbU (regulator of sigma subunit)
VDLRVEGDGETLRVTVGDGLPGALPVVDPEALSRRPYAPSGRGLALVDRIADSWGTSHHKLGKLVWFELRRDDADDELDVDGPAPDIETRTDQRILRTLERLVSATDCVAVRVCVDRADGQGEQEVASSGVPRPELREFRIQLSLTPPWIGELSLLTSGQLTTRSHQVAEVAAETVGLALDNDRLRRDDLQRRATLRYAAIASDLLAQSLDIELTHALIPRLVVPRLGEWCAVFRCDPSGRPDFAAATHADESKTGFVVNALDHPANRAAMFEALDAGLHATVSASVEGIAVPLLVRDRALGVLVVGRPADHRHTPDELAAIEDLARRAALALDNAALHADRQEVARTLQASLLPPSLPDVPGMRFGAEYLPALRVADVGGDFYDVLSLPSGGQLMVIGDVSGKGVAAAAVTGLIRDVFRILVRDQREVPEVLCRLNDTLKERGTGRFATLAIAELVPGGQFIDAQIYLAGHDRPVVARADGTTEAVGARGTAIGLLDEIGVTPVAVRLAPGDTLVFYTDGVTERRNGADLFGVARVHAALAGLGRHDADIVAAKLRAATLAFSPESPRDDIAILTVHNDA